MNLGRWRTRGERPPGRRTALGAALCGVAVLAGPLAACTPPPAENVVVYGLEAENDGGWCLPESQMSIAGLQSTRAMFDPLTVPDENGEYVPFLAKDITANDDFTEWTITLREGVTFHDGTELNSQVLKNNLDAYRGQYEGRSPLLAIFTYQQIGTVELDGEYAVKVTTLVPWRAFPAFLNNSNRFGILAQSQLDDPDTCDSQPVGTGPFMFESWSVGEKLVLKKNPDYWIKGYPLLDGMEFRPLPDPEARINAILGNEIDAMHTSDDLTIDDFVPEVETGNLNMYETFNATELSYVMLNSSKLPFSNRNARLALAYGGDLDAINQATYAGLGETRSGPFPEGTPGYLEDPGFPTYDPEKAREYARKYTEETGEPLEFELSVIPSVVGLGQLLQQLATDYDVTINLKTIDQAQLISDAIDGNFEATVFRLHPGTEPDLQSVWWSDSPVNFARFNAKDDQGEFLHPGGQKIIELMAEARSEPDQDKRTELYEEVNRTFAEEAFNIWAYSSHWGIVTQPDVKGILGTTNPDGSQPFTGLAIGHPVHGLCREGVSCPPEAEVDSIPVEVETVDDQ
ncbi:MAG: ABC transporter substrate-binding protein [Microthrixaceae bacterium]|nr:ABC transporter substrate-binding protein [Microthrixaceae bacterium]